MNAAPMGGNYKNMCEKTHKITQVIYIYITLKLMYVLGPNSACAQVIRPGDPKSSQEWMAESVSGAYTWCPKCRW